MMDGLMLKKALDPSVDIQTVVFGLPRGGNQAFADLLDKEVRYLHSICLLLGACSNNFHSLVTPLRTSRTRTTLCRPCLLSSLVSHIPAMKFTLSPPTLPPARRPKCLPALDRTAKIVQLVTMFFHPASPTTRARTSVRTSTWLALHVLCNIKVDIGFTTIPFLFFG
jgi:hypothetical protein